VIDETWKTPDETPLFGMGKTVVSRFWQFWRFVKENARRFTPRRLWPAWGELPRLPAP
jgi:hypothetical protein